MSEIKAGDLQKKEIYLAEKTLKVLQANFGTSPFTFTELVSRSNDQFYAGKDTQIRLTSLNEKPFAFFKITNYEELDKLGNSIRKEQPDSYPTPVEFKSPYYSVGIARQIESLVKLGKIEPSIYEIGGGRGTLAKDILDYYQKYVPALYKKVHYTIIDVSSKLQETQKNLLRPHKDKVTWQTADARRLPFENNSFEGIIITSELLDNLPVSWIEKVKDLGISTLSVEEFAEVSFQIEAGFLRKPKLVKKQIPLTEAAKLYIAENPTLLSKDPNLEEPTLNLYNNSQGYVGIEIRSFCDELKRVFNRGFVITLDTHLLNESLFGGRRYGSYMDMAVHTGGQKGGLYRLLESFGKVDTYFSVDCWTTDKILKNRGFQTLYFVTDEKSFFNSLFGGEKERNQLRMKDGTSVLLNSEASRFIMIHSYGLGNEVNASSLSKFVKEQAKRHQDKNENLTLGRATRF